MSWYSSILKTLAACLFCSFAWTAQAVVIDHTITLNQESGPSYVGYFGVDESYLIPNSSFQLSHFSYFTMTIGSVSWDLSMIFSTVDDLAYTDGFGEIDEFAGGGSGGITADFCTSGSNNCLGFGPLGTHMWQAYLFLGPLPCSEGRCSGTYEIARANGVPAPGMLVILGLGLGALLVARKRPVFR